MRKGQERILKKAYEVHMGELEIKFLRREDLTIDELNAVYSYFRSQLKYDTDSIAITSEAERCLALLKPVRKNGITGYTCRSLSASLLPDWREDTLIGSAKKRSLIKAFFFLSDLSEKYGVQNKFWGLSISYEKMFYEGFSAWHIAAMIRGLFRCESPHDASYLGSYVFQEIPEFKDDFINNRKASLFYLLLKMRKSDGIIAYKGLFRDLYDWENHCFLIPQEDYEKLFVEEVDYKGDIQTKLNEPFIDQLLAGKYPVLVKIREFARKELEPYNESENIVTWKKWWLEDDDLEKKCRKGYEILQMVFTVKAKACYFGIKVCGNNFVEVYFYQYGSILAGTQNEQGWCTGSCLNKRSYLISPDGRIFKKLSQGKCYPLGMKEFYNLYQREDVCGDFMKLLWNYYYSRNVFYKDIMQDVSECGTIMPLSVNEIMEYHNRAELIKKKYKTAAGIRIKWNKLNINLSYLIIKAYRCVDPGKSRQILLQQRDVSLLFGIDFNTKTAYKPYKFLSAILYEIIMKREKERIDYAIAAAEERYRKEISETVHTDILPDEYEQWIKEKVAEETGQYDMRSITNDYVNMCRQAKIKVRLDIYKIEQMKNVHDYATRHQINYRKVTKKIELPENSRFHHLREVLPEEFEWITTRKRLILETELQHHCVWSYAEDITRDKCAIYSFTDTAAEHCMDGKPKRYTIEFRQKRNGEYYVEQVQGKYDSVNANGMKEYIQSLLSDYQSGLLCK